VGVSIGIERVFAIMEGQARERAAASGTPIRATETQVLVASIGNGMQVGWLTVCKEVVCCCCAALHTVGLAGGGCCSGCCKSAATGGHYAPLCHCVAGL
jgi:histidyl-tRNA synthetase